MFDKVGLTLGGGKKKRRKGSKAKSKKKSKRIKVKLKIKGGAVGVHNAIKKLASGGADHSGPAAPMKVKISDSES